MSRLDMSLDDFGQGKGGGKRRGAGGAFRRARIDTHRNSPYTTAKRGKNIPSSDDALWSHDRFGQDDDEPVDERPHIKQERSRPAAAMDKDKDVGGFKLSVSNLNFNVTEEDVRELFEAVGEVKKVSIKFDKSGRSVGKATVVYIHKGDAIKAIREYNKRELDKQVMNVEMVETTDIGARQMGKIDKEAKILISVPAGGRGGGRRVTLPGGSGGQGRRLTIGRATARSSHGGSSGGGRRSGGGGGKGKGGGKGGRGKPKSAEELDAEMDEYKQQTD
eukprot:TRINITY_DN402_c0_g1_i3.p1 TRINITY_DN402_c0_g1~~TRINITY_DN402_c0_g1_i3.p1  ORF type:complete len:276 (+),score=112.73 TRINITY_DN402_c0_g1_i3:112-939(+)